jgi:hypothetical protein
MITSRYYLFIYFFRYLIIMHLSLLRIETTYAPVTRKIEHFGACIEENVC